MDAIITAAVLGGIVVAGWRGGRALDRAFVLLGQYSAGPRAYPDQDPAPLARHA